MAFNDRAADRQSHSQAFGLGGKKGLEKLVNLGGINAGTENCAPPRQSDRYRSGSIGLRARVFGCVRHGFDAVLDQIDYNLLQLNTVAGHDCGLGGQILLKDHAVVVQFALYNREGLLDHVIDIQGAIWVRRFLRALVFSQ